MNIRTRRTALIVAIGTALALAFSFVPTPAHGATTTHVLNYEGEVTCPDTNPIKGMTFDARSGRVTTQCYTQFYWDHDGFAYRINRAKTVITVFSVN